MGPEAMGLEPKALVGRAERREEIGTSCPNPRPWAEISHWPMPQRDLMRFKKCLPNLESRGCKLKKLLLWGHYPSPESVAVRDSLSWSISLEIIADLKGK